MATAAQVLKAALQRILVQASEADLEPDEFADAIFAMNNWMLALDADGVNLGYTEVTNLSDDITIPTGALRGLIPNVAIEISPDYDGQVTPALISAAAEGLRVMEKIGVALGQSVLPSTLPRGSGNDFEHSHHSRFFPNLETEILAETTGSIALETGTIEALG